MASPIQFIKEARAELTKVVWPDRKSIARVTLAVVLLSVVMAIFLGVIDYGLTELFETVLNKQ